MSMRRLSTLGLVCLATACGQAGITPRETTAPQPSLPVHPDATTAERLRLQAPRGHGAPSEGTTPRVSFAYDLPSGWIEEAPTDLRLVNLRVPAAEGGVDGECYLTILGSGAGGLAPNVNRWREQLGLAPVDETSLANLSTRPLFGGDAVLVELQGEPASAEAPKILGLILPLPSATAFVKMTGPTALLDAQRPNFDAWVASLRPEMGSAPPATPAPPSEPRAGSAPFTWTAPAGWVEEAPRTMRLVSFRVGSAGECYITLLGGTGGGERANLDRWRQQVGEPPLSEAEYEALPRVNLLGASCPLLVAAGDHQADAGEARAAQGLMGTVRLLREGALFVKFVGPSEEVAAAREDFVAFCESIAEGE